MNRKCSITQLKGVIGKLCVMGIFFGWLMTQEAQAAFDNRVETNAQGQTLTSPFQVTLAVPTGTTNGDIMFTWIGSFSATVTTNAAWTLVGSYTAATDKYYLFYRVASSEPASYVWTFSATSKYKATCTTYTAGDFSVSLISDLTISNTSYRTVNANNIAATMDVPNANSPLLFFGGLYTTTARLQTPPTVPTNFTEDYDAGSNVPDFSLEIASVIWAGSGATGNITSTIAVATIGTKHAFAVALKPAPPDTHYWQGVAGNWNDPTKWWATYGGIPIAGDAVVFDGNSANCIINVNTPSLTWIDTDNYANTVTQSANVTTTGDLSIKQGNWTASSGAYTITVGGNLNLGGDDASNATVNLASSTGAINITGNVDFAAASSGVATLTLGNQTLSFAGTSWDSSDTNADFNCGTSTVISTAAAGDTGIKTSATNPFYVFTKTGAGKLWMESDVTVSNYMSVTAGDFDQSGGGGNRTLTVGSYLDFFSTGTWTQLGNVVVGSNLAIKNGIWNCSSGAWTVGITGNLTIGTATTGDSTMDFTGSTGAAVTLTGNVTLPAQATSGTNTLTLGDSTTISFAGNWDTSFTASDFNCVTGTVIHTGTSGTPSIKSKDTNPFYKLSKTGSGVLYEQTSLIVTNDFTASSGTFLQTGGAGGWTLTVGGHFSSSGCTWTKSTGSPGILLNGGVAQNFTSAAGNDMGNVRISTSSTNVSLLSSLTCTSMTTDASTTLTQGANAIAVSGNWNNSGAFIQATNTPNNVSITGNLYLLNGTWTHSSGTSTLTCGDLDIGTLGGTTTSIMDFTGSSGAINVNSVNFLANASGTNTLTLGSNNLSFAYNFVANLATADFNCGASTVISTTASSSWAIKTNPGDSFYNLSKTLAGNLYMDITDIIVTKDFTLSGGAFYLTGAGGDRKLTVGGNFLISGTGTFYKSNLDQDVVLNGSVAQNFTSRGQDMGNVQISNSSTGVSLLDSLDCDTLTIDATRTLTQTAAATGNNFTTLANSGYVICQGSAADFTIGTFTNNDGSKWTYTNASGAPSVRIGTYHDLTFNDGGGAGDAVYTLASGTTNVTGTLTVTNGTLAIGASPRILNVTESVANSDIITIGTGTLDVEGSITVGTLTCSGASVINVGGSWTNSDVDLGTVFSAGASTITFDGAAAANISGVNVFWNLRCIAGPKTLNFTNNGVTSISNNLNFSGTAGNKITLAVLNDSGLGNIWDIYPAGTSGGSPGWTVDYVSVSNSYNLAATPIMPTNSLPDGGNNINWYSSATMVNLISFDAIGYFGKVNLSWRTGSELDNLGFNILRSEDGKNYEKINPELIKGLGTPILGHEYTYEDAGVVDGKTYYYLLEDVETTGKTTRHGPVTAHPGRDSDGDGMTDDWEYHYGLDPFVNDANIDSDDDGLTNLEEFLAGTDPLAIDSQDAAGNNGVKIIESSGLRTVLELGTSTLKVTDRNEGGMVYQLITLPEYAHGQITDVGKPRIPTKGILLGTLSKKPVAINILEYEKETYPDYNIYPVPKAVLTEDPNDPAIKRLTYEFYKDTDAYSIDAFYPGALAEVDYSNYLQGQQVIKVIFYPIQFNPVSGTMEFYKRIRLEVIQEGADLAVTASTVAPKTALPLTAENAYKIYINENGIYRLTMPYLESQGVSLSGVDPRNLKIYNQGAEIPIYVSGSDYIEFYGQAVDTRYAGTNVYWLVLSDEPGLRMSASGQVEDATVTPGSFIETYKGEDNTLYWQEAVGEDHWFIDAIYGSQVYSLYLNLNGVANSADEAIVKIALEGSRYSGAEFTHRVCARLNGYPIADVSWQGATDYTIDSRISQSYLNEGANTVTLEAGADPTGFEEILVNWVEVSYRRNFTAKDNVLAFGNYTGGAYKYQISGFTDQDVEIYDITDPKGVQKITQFTVLPEDSTFTASFKDAGSKDYIVLTQDKAKVPAGVLRDEPSNLADKENKADYIIITHPDFYETILPFAEYRSAQGLKVKVVKLDDIYDEFNYGIADVNAVKDFLKYAYNNWTGGKPNYVLLVGDATYDYRDYSGYGFTNYVPTYLVNSLTFGETGSDSWFVCLDGENDVIPDMLIGRFPVKTADELKSMIDRITAYEAISPDEAWTKKVLLVADNDEKIFTDTSEKLASYLTEDYTADKQYLGETTNSPAALKQGIINAVNEGRLFVNYAGHGGIGLWANERIFTWDDINSLYNRNTLPVITTLTCADGYFVYPRYIESLGERLVNGANGGAIAVFVPSGISYPTTQAYLAQGFYGAYFKDNDAILGSMVAKGKLSVYENESGGDAINVIQTFNLFGDPALRVKMKAPQIPAVAAPEVFDLDKGKVNDIFRLTEEPKPKAAESAESSTVTTVIVDNKVKDTKQGLTKIIRVEEAAPVVAPPSEKSSLENKAPEEKRAAVSRGVKLEDKTVALAPPKWRVLSKAEYGALKAAKPYVNIDYSAIEKGVTDINEDASQLAELRANFDKAVKDNDLQKASSIFSDITKLARKIYWRTF